MPSVCEGILQSRARGLLELFQRKGLLPRTLKLPAALGDLDAVRAALDEHGDDLATVNEGFVRGCSFKNETVASLLLERFDRARSRARPTCRWKPGRPAFIKYFIETRAAAHAKAAVGPWKASVMEQVSRAAHEGDVTTLLGVLRRESWLLGEAYVGFQDGLIGAAILNDRGAIIAALLDLEPRYCAAGRRPRRKRSSTHSPTRRRTSFHYSPASGRCPTIYRMRQASATSRG